MAAGAAAYAPPTAAHRPDIRTPELVNPLLREFLLNP